MLSQIIFNCNDMVWSYLNTLTMLLITYKANNLCLMVDMCPSCNQKLYYWKMAILGSNIQWCHSILEEKNYST